MIETENELRQLTLGLTLIDHLAVEDSVFKLWSERFSKDYLVTEGQGADSDEIIAGQILDYQYAHLQEHGSVATPDVLGYSFDIDFEVPTSEIDWLISEFRIRHQKNRGQRILEAAAKSLMKDPASTIATAASEFSALKNETRPQSILITTADYKSVLDEYFAVEDTSNAVSFGFPEMDKHLIGLMPGRFYTHIARPKRFKSFMQPQCAIAAQRQGKTVALFQLEMTKEETFQRYACVAANISWTRFIRKQLLPKEKKALYDEMEQLSDPESLVHIIRPSVGERKVQDIQLIAQDLKADVVLVDQMSFIKSRRSYGERRNLEIEEICEEIKESACENIPWYVACQFNREANESEESFEDMADLKRIGLSDAIGQKSDLILATRQTKQMRESNLFQFGVVEARNFAKCVWNVTYDLANGANFFVSEIDE